MMSRRNYAVLIAILITFLVNSFALARPIDLDNLKEYNFEGPLEQKGKNHSLVSNLLSFGFYLILLLVICVMAYYTTRWLSKHQSSVTIKSKYMEVIDAIPLGSESRVYIVRAPQGLLMLGASQKNICILDKLGPEEKEMIEEAEMGFLADRSFASQLERFLLKKKHQNKNGDMP